MHPALASPTFRRNIEALFEHRPELSARIREAAVLDGVVATPGRDGSDTFRITQANGARAWLGHSSMPTISAPALLADFNAGGGNVVLPSMGHGGEVRRLLDSLHNHQAVFTVDSDARIPALALCLHDFSADIRLGRLVPAVHADPQTALEDGFDAHPTHLPPTRMLSAPHLSPQELHRLQGAVEAAGRAQYQRLIRLTREARQQIADLGPPRQAPHLILIASMVPEARLCAVAAGLARAAEELGTQGLTHVADAPGRVHLAALADCIRRTRPHTVILLNQIPQELGDLLMHTPRRAVWFLTATALRPELSSHLAAVRPLWVSGESLATRVRSANPDVRVLSPAVDPLVFYPVDLAAGERRRFGSDVAIIQDASPESAAAMGFKWESHQALLKQIVHDLDRNPQRLDAATAMQLLEAASRRCRVHLDEGEARQILLRYMTDWLAPTAFVRRLAQLMRDMGIGLKLWGSNWELHNATAGAPSGPAPGDVQRNRIYNASTVVVLVGGGPLESERLLEALAAGASVLRLRSSTTDEDTQLQEVQQAVPAFANTGECSQLIRRILAGDEALKASLDRARRLVLQKHLIRHRLSAILESRTP